MSGLFSFVHLECVACVVSWAVMGVQICRSNNGCCFPLARFVDIRMCCVGHVCCYVCVVCYCFVDSDVLL